MTDQLKKELTDIINRVCNAELGQVHTNSKDSKVTTTISTRLIVNHICKYLNENYMVIPKETYSEIRRLESETAYLRARIECEKEMNNTYNDIISKLNPRRPI